MHFSFFRDGAPDEVSLNSINGMVDFARDMNVLYDMVSNGSKGVFGEDGPSIHIEEFDFPSNKLSVHIIQDKREITICRIFVKNRKL